MHPRDRRRVDARAREGLQHLQGSERRGIGGARSGAIAAFTVPGNVPTSSARSEHRRQLREPARWSCLQRHRSQEREKPLRVFLQDGRNDNRGVGRGGASDETRDWFLQNVSLMRALTDKGYDVNYTWGIGRHGQKQGGAIFPDMRCDALARSGGIDRRQRCGRALVQYWPGRPKGRTVGPAEVAEVAEVAVHKRRNGENGREDRAVCGTWARRVRWLGERGDGASPDGVFPLASVAALQPDAGSRRRALNAAILLSARRSERRGWQWSRISGILALISAGSALAALRAFTRSRPCQV